MSRVKRLSHARQPIGRIIPESEFLESSGCLIAELLKLGCCGEGPACEHTMGRAVDSRDSRRGRMLAEVRAAWQWIYMEFPQDGARDIDSSRMQRCPDIVLDTLGVRFGEPRDAPRPGSLPAPGSRHVSADRQILPGCATCGLGRGLAREWQWVQSQGLSVIDHVTVPLMLFGMAGVFCRRTRIGFPWLCGGRAGTCWDGPRDGKSHWLKPRIRRAPWHEASHFRETCEWPFLVTAIPVTYARGVCEPDRFPLTDQCL